MPAGYVAYIDESGDDGLWKVQPVDPVGASEWFILSAMVVPTSLNREAIWVQRILADLGLHQRRTLHFQSLDDHHKLAVCEALAALPIRCFAVASHKPNMRRHVNEKAARVSYAVGRTWFYWWMTRLLLERVTDYCERRGLHEHGEKRLVRLEFSRRGGLRYEHCQGYLTYLRDQSATGKLHLKRGDLKWSVVDAINEIRVFNATERAGLQIADVVAGAFFQAGTEKPNFAMALEQRMASNADGVVFDYGVKLMPGWYLKQATGESRRAFDHYVSLRKRQAPGS
jgi:hypothetical protein